MRDADGTALPLLTSDVAPRLFAMSGGHPVTLVAEWDGSWLRPLAAFTDGRLASVTTDAESTDVKVDDPEWSALVSAALLGTERTGGNAPIPATVAGLVAGADTERAILAAAGSMAVRRRAGRTTTIDETPSPRPAEPDPRTQLADAAARYVALAFDELPSLVPEILDLVRATGRRLPDEWLPNLMALARRSDDVDAYVELGGTRAAWLARTFPELAGDVWWGTGEDWDEAWAATETGAARAAVVRRSRQSDLPRARAALATWWASIPTPERARVLEAVEVRVEPADEPFLTEALDRRPGGRAPDRGGPPRAAPGFRADPSHRGRSQATPRVRRPRPQESQGHAAVAVGGARGAGFRRPA